MSDYCKPMDTTLMDMGISIDSSINLQDPPAEDSPMNIVNKLNNFCIQAIFQRIDNVRDYHSLANTCKRLQANAISGYPAHLKALTIYNDLYEYDMNNRPNGIPFNEAESYLMLFGHLIQSLKWIANGETNNTDILNLIARYCGNTLKDFEIERSECDYIYALPYFTALEKLSVDNVNVTYSYVTNIVLRSPLKELRIISDCSSYRVNTWFMQSFPQLESIEFHKIQHLTSNMVIHFLNLNPQLRCIKMVYCSNLDTDSFIDIGHRVPNLEQFSFITWYSTPMINEHLRHLGNLKKLKNLAIETCSRVRYAELVRLLFENQMPIESLSIDGKNDDDLANVPAIDGLINLTVADISENVLLSLMMKHPKLTELRVHDSSNITMNGVKNALEFGENLKTITFDYVADFHVDEDNYEAVWALVENRVKLHIFVHAKNVTVPREKIDANREWFDLVLSG